MLYRVDYSIKDMAKFDATKATTPKYVVANDFYAALKAAKKFETDNLTLMDCSLHTADGTFAVARGFKSFEAPSEGGEVVVETATE